jgi:hypothetical protein
MDKGCQRKPAAFALFIANPNPVVISLIIWGIGLKLAS